METKFCKKCATTKSVDKFSKNKNKKDGLQIICKECKKAEDKQWYLENKNKRKYYNKKHRNKISKWINEYKSSLGCQCCGYNGYPECMDFHHIGGYEKDFDISLAYKQGYSIEKIKKEIQKCVVVCAICHREIHCGYRSVAQLAEHLTLVDTSRQQGASP